MKRKTLIRLFLTSSIFLLFVAGCNKDVTSVTDTEELNNTVKIEAENTIASVEDETIITSEITNEKNVTSEEEKVEDANIESESEEIEVKKTNAYVPGMPSADLEKYNNYRATVEPTTDTVETEKQTSQKKETTKTPVAKEEVDKTPIEVVNPLADATTTNVSQEMANLLNAKRGELGFPQTVEVIPESEVDVHNAMKQMTINLYAVGFNHESSVGVAPNVHLEGSVIGKSTLKDSANVFNGWMNSPGHYNTIIPNDAYHLYPDDVMQVVCYVYGPADGYYYYNLSYRIKPTNGPKEDWQQPYIDDTPTEPTPGAVENPTEQPGTSVQVEDQPGYIDNYLDEMTLDMLVGTDDFWPYFHSRTPELQEYYRNKHPELFN